MSTADSNDRPSGGAVPVDPDDTLRNRVVDREKEEFGGIKWGSAFFGWLTATGMAVLLTALLAAAGAVVGLTTGTDPQEATDAAAQNLDAASIVSAIVLLVVLFVAYYCGGYVAGRMARFNGAKQGLAVWLWALIFAIVLAILGAVLGSQFNVLSGLNAFPRIPVNEGTLTVVGIITAIVLALVPLIGAVLGGKAGMHYHRKVDRAGLGR
ncbi:hypothetical protein ACFFGH_21950 [Lysobacter korlensis]|uniref:Major facilitator superfamily (MFS) profile domain-containing protein n=1 Tax=Lysobacter korlensis TaxID=553636 RepID=A0ABV6RU55_9GAMM